MHSKFRLFAGSVLLLALPAFGQATEPTPAAATAAPVVEMEGSGAVSDGDVHNQFGDGVYAVTLSDMAPTGEKWTTVGFVLIVNNQTSPAVSDIGQWVLSERVMATLKLSAKLPLPTERSVRLDFVGTNSTLSSAAEAFLRSPLGSGFAKDTFKATKVTSVGKLLSCSGTISTLQCL
jgi:hypothetical protein